MGSAILAVSLLNVLPLPPAVQESTVVNVILAGVGALCGALAARAPGRAKQHLNEAQ
jgi:hypothetical protein